MIHTPPQQTNNTGLIATVVLAGFVAPMNSTMMAVALVPIRDEFSVSTGSAGWLIIAYLVVIAVMQPLGGRLGDQLGRQRLFMIGVVSFIIVSTLATFAWSFPSVVFFRVLQAVAGGLIFPNGIALLRASIPAERRARTFGLVGAIMGLSVAGGPTFGECLQLSGHGGRSLPRTYRSWRLPSYWRCAISQPTTSNMTMRGGLILRAACFSLPR